MSDNFIVAMQVIANIGAGFAWYLLIRTDKQLQALKEEYQEITRLLGGTIENLESKDMQLHQMSEALDERNHVINQIRVELKSKEQA